jgi:hypothetical protein
MTVKRRGSNHNNMGNGFYGRLPSNMHCDCDIPGPVPHTVNVYFPADLVCADRTQYVLKVTLTVQEHVVMMRDATKFSHETLQ